MTARAAFRVISARTVSAAVRNRALEAELTRGASPAAMTIARMASTVQASIKDILLRHRDLIKVLSLLIGDRDEVIRCFQLRIKKNARAALANCPNPERSMLRNGIARRFLDHVDPEMQRQDYPT